ncbi:hypothetical protein LO762_01565 [Actinocorallia sp. API 0066]|uniref:hypothetical protein n=1 Tax=Actinocorallia sp. API 0066 TaxID=2896846 RepID=UPI001E5AD5BE|nr:hypothetical protein [Actinocorallia sp. API 0066]MCD0447888.1 hypothetical protein [Actinocorallia sp. API 0066]
MRLTFLGKESDHGDSPTLYATDRNSYVIQGYVVGRADMPPELDIPDGETVVRIYARLLPHLAKDGLSGIVAHRTAPVVGVLDNGDLIIQGTRVTDPEALDHLAIPTHEDAVEVTREAMKAVLRE